MRKALKWYRIGLPKTAILLPNLNLNLRYEYGWGVPQDDKERTKWHNKASPQFHTLAGYKQFGWMPRDYEEVAQEIEETVNWYRTAAEHGYTQAQFRLAKLYEYGWVVPRYDEKAVRWYHAAAEHGDADAQFELGLRYEHGRGVLRNIEEAIKWYRKAAQQGFIKAQHHLDLKYNFGRGVSENDSGRSWVVSQGCRGWSCRCPIRAWLDVLHRRWDPSRLW